MTQSNLNYIYEFIYTNPRLDKSIIQLVQKDLRDDMKTHLILEVNKMNPDKVVKLYNDKNLIKYLMRILYHQMSPKCHNCFQQLYRPTIYRNSESNNYDNYDDFTQIDTPDYEYYFPLPSVEEKVVKDIMRYVRSSVGLEYYMIFYYSYIEGRSNKEISYICNTGIQTIVNWKTKILNDIKRYMKSPNGYAINNK